ncbi:hypothetical protein GCM10009558_086210 [Virgisporangium aurantiacum]
MPDVRTSMVASPNAEYWAPPALTHPRSRTSGQLVTAAPDTRETRSPICSQA